MADMMRALILSHEPKATQDACELVHKAARADVCRHALEGAALEGASVVHLDGCGIESGDSCGRAAMDAGKHT
jgi:hypothetical protein